MKKFFVVFLIGVMAVWFMPTKEAQAIAAWSRRYNADCSMCHTMYPRLNPTGQRFRRLGYKMPEEFDSAKEAQLAPEEMAKFTNYMSARTRPRFLVTKQHGTPANFSFELEDVTLFYAGPATKNVGFFAELAFEPAEEKGFVEVGQLNLNFGKSDSFFFLRTGLMHQFSKVGYGGLDRQIALSFPSLVQNRINGFAFRQDGLGIESGYSNGNLTALVQFTNGLNATNHSITDNTDLNKHKDVGILLEYLIPDHDASVSALYVYGKEPTPQNNAGALVAGARDVKYNRMAIFADYTFDKIHLKPLFGFAYGIDNEFVSGIGSATATLVRGTTSRSWSTFLELDEEIIDNLYLVGRFEMIHPTQNSTGNAATKRTYNGTGALVWGFQKWLRTTLEYRATDNAAQALASSVTGELQLVF